MKRKSSVYKALVLVMQFGINMLVPIFLGLIVGLFLYKKTGTAIPLIVLFFVGALAGFRNCYIQAKRVYDEKPGDETEKP